MSKIAKDKKSFSTGEKTDDAAFAFGRENYILLLLSAAILLVGYFLMAGGRADNPNEFNEAVFSFRRISLAPVIVMLGYALGIYAIVKKAD